MPFNPSGLKPSSSFLSVPRACVKAAFLGDDDRPIGAFRDLGDVSGADIAFSTEEAEHYTSCGEQRIRDSRITTELSADLTMELDHILVTENMELAVSGQASNEDAQDQSGARTGVIFVPNPVATNLLGDGVAIGRQYKLWSAGANRIYAGMNPTNLQVDLDGAGGSGIVQPDRWFPGNNIFGVDASQLVITAPSLDSEYQGEAGGASHTVASGAFTVNPVQGTLFIPQESALAQEIRDIGLANLGQPMIALALSYNGDAATSPAKIPTIQALARSARPVALYFEQQDTARPGYRKVTMIHKVRLTPNGDVPLVGDGTDFATITIEGGVEQPSWKTGVTGNEGFYDIQEVAGT